MKNSFKFFTLPLFIIFFLANSCTRNGKEQTSPTISDNSGNSGVVEHVRDLPRDGEDVVVTSVAAINEIGNKFEILFHERQARYILDRQNPRFSAILGLAREALTQKHPVKLIASPSEEISNLILPTTAEKNAYLEWYRNNLTDVDLDRKVNVRLFDTATFNYESRQPWKVFRVCTKVIPDFATAQTIFNYCKQQMCGSIAVQITPCIPFNYVKDGCFARAHKMRSIIESKYRYCSEKVFSYGNLDVKANLWGGCCIGWWYHVAPLVRVKTPLGNLLYVIDPSMFTGPVLLSTWLSAQESTTCDGTSDLATYAIQPSSAYTPVGYINNVTGYTTDPGYTQTNSHLIYYAAQGVSCP